MLSLKALKAAMDALSNLGVSVAQAGSAMHTMIDALNGKRGDMKDDLINFNVYDVILCPVCGEEITVHGGGEDVNSDRGYCRECAVVFKVASQRDSMGMRRYVLASASRSSVGHIVTNDNFEWRIMFRWNKIPRWVSVTEGKEVDEINRKIKERWECWKMAEALSSP